MSNFIVMELARDPETPEEWFWTGNSFIATSTGYTVEQLASSDFFVRNFRRQCDQEFGTWEGVEILPFPDSTHRPTIWKAAAETVA